MKKSKIDKCVSYINEYIKIIELDSEEMIDQTKFDRAEFRSFSKNKRKQFINLSQLNYSVEELVLVQCYRSDMDNDKTVDEFTDCIINEIQNNPTLLKNVQSLPRTLKCSIVVFVETIEDKLKVNSCYKTLKKSINKSYISKLDELIKSSKDEALKKFRRNLRINAFPILLREVPCEEVKISSINRYEIVEMPPLSKNLNIEKKLDSQNSKKGYVLTVNLFNIVEVYNNVGDDLFKYNVRFGLKDQLGVDESIKHTLLHEPEEFWFRNNGITIVVESKDFKLDRSNEILLHGEGNEELNFSVINGAQTIKASASYFYGDNDENTVEKVARSKSDANVILRIIHIPKDSMGSSVQEVSIALNRQKPIRQEDIAYGSEYVSSLLSFVDDQLDRDNLMLFNIVRRGEQTAYTSIRSHELVTFAKIMTALDGRPGSARSDSSSKLLKIVTDEYGNTSFENKSLHDTNWLDNRSTDKFNELFGYVNALDSVYRNVNDSIKITNKEDLITKNGKWYIATILLEIIRVISSDDIDKVYDKIGVKKYNSLVDIIVNFINNAADDSEIDSNSFKKQVLYDKLMSFDYMEDLIDTVTRVAEVIEDEDFSVPYQYVFKILKTTKIIRKDYTTAYEDAVRGLLLVCEDIDDVVKKMSFLDVSSNEESFTSSRELDVWDHKLVLNTHNSTDVKRANINRLIEILGFEVQVNIDKE